MGRKNKSYARDLHQQAYDRLPGMQAFGESKREAVAQGTGREMIFSINTYKDCRKWLQAPILETYTYNLPFCIPTRIVPLIEQNDIFA